MTNHHTESEQYIVKQTNEKIPKWFLSQAFLKKQVIMQRRTWITEI